AHVQAHQRRGGRALMTPRLHLLIPGGPGDATSADEVRWDGLRTLIRARLLVATLALPMGILLRPEATQAPWLIVAVALAAVGVLSGLLWLGGHLHGHVARQGSLQAACDLALV